LVLEVPLVPQEAILDPHQHWLLTPPLHLLEAVAADLRVELELEPLVHLVEVLHRMVELEEEVPLVHLVERVILILLQLVGVVLVEEALVPVVSLVVAAAVALEPLEQQGLLVLAEDLVVMVSHTQSLALQLITLVVEAAALKVDLANQDLVDLVEADDLDLVQLTLEEVQVEDQVDLEPKVSMVGLELLLLLIRMPNDQNWFISCKS